MAWNDVSSRDAVFVAIDEYDRVGAEEYLKIHEYGRRRTHSLVHSGKAYEVKAILGVAHQYQFPERGALRSSDFHAHQAARQLRKLGFQVRIEPEPAAAVTRELEHAEKSQQAQAEFALPVDDQDARQKMLRSIVIRRGQPRFRRDLLEAYDRRCAVTGYDVVEVLEAAHILPYRGEAFNHLTNGLLLRADLHLLFDLGLIAIDSVDLTLLVSESLDGTDYAVMKGRALTVPDDPAKRPNREALERHRATATAG